MGMGQKKEHSLKGYMIIGKHVNSSTHAFLKFKLHWATVMC